MIKHRRIVYFGLAALLLGACYAASTKAKAAEITPPDQVKLIKPYDLTNNVDYVEFTIESTEGEFQSNMVLPDGHIVKGSGSTKQIKEDGISWTVTFAVNKPARGAYRFEITALQQGYYNLSADVPLFSDIARHWARTDVSDFVQKGIVAGYGDGRFGPDDPVTGEALVKMLVLALTEEQPHGNRQWIRLFRWKVMNVDVALEMGLQEYTFAQATGSDWPNEYLAAAGDLGILSRWDATKLKKPFARKDVALMIANVLQLVDNKEQTSELYTDTSTLSENIQNAISKVSSYAIFGGYPDGSFQPNEFVTRAEAVKVLARLEAYLNS